MTTASYFERSFRRVARSPTGQSGQLIQDDEGNSAIFWLESDQGLIVSVHYKCTTCVTLMAFCQHLSELAVGTPASEAIRYEPEHLIALHPDVPSYRTNRAKLASDAFRSAVQQIHLGETN